MNTDGCGLGLSELEKMMRQDAEALCESVFAAGASLNPKTEYGASHTVFFWLPLFLRAASKYWELTVKIRQNRRNDFSLSENVSWRLLVFHLFFCICGAQMGQGSPFSVGRSVSKAVLLFIQIQTLCFISAIRKPGL